MKAIHVIKKESSYTTEIIDTPVPKPKENEILIKVEASAMNRAELMVMDGIADQYIEESPILGLEVSGIIVEIGSEVKTWKKGDRAAALLKNGGYAEYAIAHGGMAFSLPTSFSAVEMAAIPEGFLLAYQLLKWIGEVKKNDTVLIHAGTSGMGSAAIQMAKAFEANVITTSRSSAKADRCKSLGADFSIAVKDNKFSDEVRSFTSDIGVNVILDSIGQPYVDENLKSLAKDGTLVLYEAMGGNIEKIDLASIYYDWTRIVGTTLRPRPIEYKTRLVQKFLTFAAPLFSNGTLKPIVHKDYPIEDINSAYAALRKNENIGKIILRGFDS